MAQAQTPDSATPETPSAQPSPEQPWVKPSFERIPLNEATNNVQTTGDDGTSPSGS